MVQVVDDVQQHAMHTYYRMIDSLQQQAMRTQCMFCDINTGVKGGQ